MADFRALLSGKLSWTFNGFSIHSDWLYRAGLGIQLDLIEIKTPRLPVDLLRHVSTLRPSACNVERSCQGAASLIKPDGELPRWATWWLQSLDVMSIIQPDYDATFVLLLPNTSGYAVRKDIFEQRLGDCSSIRQIWSHLDTAVQITEMPSRALDLHSNLSLHFEHCICGLLFDIAQDSPSTVVTEVVADRLSMPLLVKQKLERRKIALVKAGTNPEFLRDLFTTIDGLGIRLSVFDKEPHWLQTPEHSHKIDHFFAVDMRIDDGLPQRLAEAVRSSGHHIDGIITFSDPYLCSTAAAAELLGMPTSRSKALGIAVNKQLLRELLPLPGTPHRLPSTEGPPPKTQYPLILKPSNGSGSLGIFLANNKAEEDAAAAQIHHLGKEVVVEPYMNGPEVDVNIVLMNKKVIFWEVSDNLPCTAESFPSNFSASSWTETAGVFPSALPLDEVERLRDYAANSLLRMGFEWGVFHCEARVQNSSMTYTQLPNTAWPRLVPIPSPSPPCPLSHSSKDGAQIGMIEVNARPPGPCTTAGTTHAYGVDYIALNFIASLRDEERFVSLCTPYKRSPSGWWASVFIPIERAGVFRAKTTFEQLAITHPELMQSVVSHLVLFKDGDTIPDPAITGRAMRGAWFLVRSDVGREHVESVAARVEGLVEYTVE